MNNINRRTFVKQTGSGLAYLATLGSAYGAEKLASHQKPQKVIEAHIHYTVENLVTCLKMMDAHNIAYMVNQGLFWTNLSYQPKGHRYFLKAQKICNEYRDRFGLLYDLHWSRCKEDPQFFKKAPDLIEEAVEAGALGLKIWKNIGLWETDSRDKLIGVDDPRMFPVWERIEKLGCILSIHVADALGNFQPRDKPSRWDFSDSSKYPARDTIIQQRINIMRRYPKVIVNGCHMAIQGENLKSLSEQLEEFPNFHLDISAFLGVLAENNSPEELRKFFIKYQDRIMFGSDFAMEKHHVWEKHGMEDYIKRMYDQHWNFFQSQTVEKEGKIKVGISLPPNVLKKIYWDNAYKFYRLNRFGV